MVDDVAAGKCTHRQMNPFDIGGWMQAAVGGSMALAIPVALLAGLVSFFSPCVVPLLPGYLAYASGLGAAEVIEGNTPSAAGCSPAPACSCSALPWCS